MDLFRIAREPYINDLSGEGARLYGGRWNRKGIPVLYCSPSISLAAMEVLVNTPMVSMPDDLQLLMLSVPDNIRPEQITVNTLPDNWSASPAPELLRDMGSGWIESQSSLLLKVPSAVIPLEWNILANPAHPEFEHVKKLQIHPFRFDERLIREIP
jgi:RES domain-containing protein